MSVERKERSVVVLCSCDANTSTRYAIVHRLISPRNNNTNTFSYEMLCAQWDLRGDKYRWIPSTFYRTVHAP